MWRGPKVTLGECFGPLWGGGAGNNMKGHKQEKKKKFLSGASPDEVSFLSIFRLVPRSRKKVTASVVAIRK